MLATSPLLPLLLRCSAAACSPQHKCVASPPAIFVFGRLAAQYLELQQPTPAYHSKKDQAQRVAAHGDSWHKTLAPSSAKKPTAADNATTGSRFPQLHVPCSADAYLLFHVPQLLLLSCLLATPLLLPLWCLVQVCGGARILRRGKCY